MRIDYKEYMQSVEWQEKREEALARANYKCQFCGKRHRDFLLEVHHLTYVRLGNEHPKDLMVLCKECHPFFDEMRERNKWAEKNYGKNWKDNEEEILKKYESYKLRKIFPGVFD